IVLVITAEDRRAAREDLSGLRDFHFGARDRQADGVKTDVPVAMNTGNATDFGLTIDLFQRHADSVKKPKHIRPQGRAAGGPAAYPTQAQPILQRPKQTSPCQPIGHPPLEWNRFFLEVEIPELVPDRHEG